VTAPPSPEFLLLAACCRWPRDPGAVAAAAQAIDWQRFARLVRRHRVQGFAQASLRAASVALPENAAKLLASMAADQARTSLAYAADLGRIAQAFEAEGLAPTLFKGPMLAQRLYGDLAIKQTGDVDVLVAAPDGWRAVAAAEKLGYRRISYDGALSPVRRGTIQAVFNGITMRHGDSGRLLDLHWRLTTNPYLFTPRESVREIDFRGRKVRTLADGDLALYLASHGAKHNWARLKWLADFNAFLVTAPREDVAAWRMRAKAEGMAASFEAALALCSTLLGSQWQAPPAIGARARWLIALSHNLMRGGGEIVEQVARPGQGVAQATLASFMQKRGLRYQAVNVWLASFKRDDAVLLALPAPLRPFYILIGPAMRLGRNLGRLARLALPGSAGRASAGTATRKQ